MASKRIPKINVGEFPYVDIMPVSRRDAIERGIAKAKWVKIVTAGTIVAVVLSAGSFGFKFINQLSHDSAVNAQASVEEEIATFADVDNALTIRDYITNNILRSSEASVKWQDIMQRVRSNLPANSELTSFEVVTGGTNDKDASVAVLVSIASAEPIAYSTVLDSFGKINGLIDGSLQIGNLATQGSAEGGDAKYVYPVAFSIDNSVLAHIFSYLDEDAENTQDTANVQEEQPDAEADESSQVSEILDDAKEAAAAEENN